MNFYFFIKIFSIQFLFYFNIINSSLFIIIIMSNIWNIFHKNSRNILIIFIIFYQRWYFLLIINIFIKYFKIFIIYLKINIIFKINKWFTCLFINYLINDFWKIIILRRRIFIIQIFILNIYYIFWMNNSL